MDGEWAKEQKKERKKGEILCRVVGVVVWGEM